MSCDEFTIEDRLRVLQAALGVDRYGRGIQYRRHFVAEPGSAGSRICDRLVQEGLMEDAIEGWSTPEEHVYFVTPNGIGWVAFNSQRMPQRDTERSRPGWFSRTFFGNERPGEGELPRPWIEPTTDPRGLPDLLFLGEPGDKGGNVGHREMGNGHCVWGRGV